MKGHIILGISIVLYVVVVIVSNFYMPFGGSDEGFAEVSDSLFGESYMSIMSYDFMFQGVAEIINALNWLDDNVGLNWDRDKYIFFASAIGATFTLLSILKRVILSGGFDFLDGDDDDDDDINPFEKLIYDYLLDNVVLYIGCVLSKLWFPPVWRLVERVNSDFLMWAVLLAMLVGVIIPMLPQLVYLFAQLVALVFINKLLAVIDESMTIGIKGAIMFVVAVVLIIVLNLLTGAMLEKLQVLAINLIIEIAPKVLGIYFAILGGLLAIKILFGCVVPHFCFNDEDVLGCWGPLHSDEYFEELDDDKPSVEDIVKSQSRSIKESKRAKSSASREASRSSSIEASKSAKEASKSAKAASKSASKSAKAAS